MHIKLLLNFFTKQHIKITKNLKLTLYGRHRTHTNTFIYLVVMSHPVRWIKVMEGLVHIPEKNLTQ